MQRKIWKENNMEILAFGLKICKRSCNIAEATFMDFFFFKLLEDSSMLNLSPFVPEQYLRLYSVVCEPTYALSEGCEVCQ